MKYLQQRWGSANDTLEHWQWQMSNKVHNSGNPCSKKYSPKLQGMQAGLQR